VGGRQLRRRSRVDPREVERAAHDANHQLSYQRPTIRGIPGSLLRLSRDRARDKEGRLWFVSGPASR
jgi:hypothetical protein